MDVVFKWSGSVHDARVFANSKLNEGLTSEIISLCRRTILEDEELIPFFIIGDPAYSLNNTLRDEGVC